MLGIRIRTLFAALIGLPLAMAGGASASPITYTIVTTSNGSLGGTGFSNARVTLSFVGDTTNVASSAPGVFYNSTGTNNATGTATVTVDGLGTATFTEPISVYAYQPGSAVGFFNDTSFSPNSYTGGLLNLTAPGYASYDLSTSFGPVAGGSFTSFTPAGFSTNLGALVLIPAAGTFSATLTPSTVPEPASLALLGLGSIGMISCGLGARRLRA